MLLLQVTAASQTAAAVGAAEAAAETAVATAGWRQEELVLDHRGAGGGRKLEVVGLHGAVDKSVIFLRENRVWMVDRGGKERRQKERKKGR